MSTEKENKGWKDDFLAWERRGGDAPQENVRWEKLQARLLPGKPVKRNWLRAAAAILFLAGSSWLIWQTRRPLQGSGFYLTLPSVKISGPVKKNYLFSPDMAKTKRVSPLINPGSNRWPEQKAIINPPVAIIKESSIPRDAMQEAITSQPGDSITIRPVAALPSRKKLRVVHLNEWNAPPPPTYATLKETGDKKDLFPGTENCPLPERSIWPGKNKNRQPVSSNN